MIRTVTLHQGNVPDEASTTHDITILNHPDQHAIILSWKSTDIANACEYMYGAFDLPQATLLRDTLSEIIDHAS